MRLNRLRLTNFRLHADTVIEFDSGLTGIIGPNGSGKTTILEAIAWALYGMPAVRGKRQDIRSLAATGRAGVKVELDFELSGHRHRVVRTLSGAELFLDGSTAPIANSTSSVTDIVRRRLGMTQQEFFATYFTGQKELGVMAAMGPAERAQFLSRVLGYEKLRSAQVLVRERRNVIRGELSGLQAAMPESELVARQLADARERLAGAETRARTALARMKKATKTRDELAPKWAEARERRDAFQRARSELAVRESEAVALTRDVERLDRELADIAAARAEIDAISAELDVHKDLAAQLLEMERLFQEEGRRKELVKSSRLLEQEIVELREKQSSMAAAGAALEQATAARDQCRLAVEEAAGAHERPHTEWVRDLQEAQTRHQQLREQHADTKAQRERLVDLGPESPCPICTRPLADHFREVLDELDGKLSEISVNGKYFRKRVKQLEGLPAPLRELSEKLTRAEEALEQANRRVTEAQLRAQELAQVERDLGVRTARLAELQAQIGEIPPGYHETRHAQLRQQHAQLAPMAERSVRLGALAEREPRVRKDLERAKRELARVAGQVTALRDGQSALRFSEDAFTKLQSRVDAASEDLRQSELDALGAEKELDAARVAQDAAESARKELERAQELVRGLTLDRRIHEELDRAYTDIRADLNQHLRPEISELASDFLAELTDGRYTDLELDESYNIIVLEDNVPKPVMSGGEEDLANLVLRLAISQMIAERAGQSFSLLILDEVFGSLDEARRHNVVELLRRLHDRFEQVVLITHIESVRDGLDRVLAVRYDPEAGVSRVEREDALADAGPSDVLLAAAAG